MSRQTGDDESSREPSTSATDVVVPERSPELVRDHEDLLQRWEALQAAFVDEPRRAVEKADQLVAETIDSITRQFARSRQALEQQWSAGADASTEDLRVAFQRYRSFFQRLLDQR